MDVCIKLLRTGHNVPTWMNEIMPHLKCMAFNLALLNCFVSYSCFFLFALALEMSCRKGTVNKLFATVVTEVQDNGWRMSSKERYNMESCVIFVKHFRYFAAISHK